ncbi:putative metal-nicotianamine transporter YSL5 [Carex littledalei]|uniref:Putative metal-nicotianamine transporter YSL5 n=1 Tax=Carex littledalei TaxID=544730 RepID=A0A833VGE7_9POAL|nr:putative metal-nicotianamine transporter YSL5 [Carex littledalei]
MGISEDTKPNPQSDAYEGEEMVEVTGLRQRNRPNGFNGESDDQALTVEQAFESKPIPGWREQLTFRAFFVAFFLAVLFSVIVMKLSLTTGIIPSLNVAAGLLGFFFTRMWTVTLEKWGMLKQPFTRQENTVIQTAVVAAYGLAKQVKLLGKFFAGTFLWGFFQWFYTGGDDCGFVNFPTLGLKAYNNRFYFDFSPTYVGVGMICPYIVNISVLLGGILSWGLMWPLINNKKGEWYSASLPDSSLQGLQGYRVFISVALILGDGLYNFVKVLSHTFFALYKAWKIKSKLPITDSDGNVVSAETISFDDKRRTELFLKDQIPKKFALGGYVCLAIISIVTLPYIFKPLKCEDTEPNPQSDTYEGEEMVEVTGLRQRNIPNSSNGESDDQTLTVEQVFESSLWPSYHRWFAWVFLRTDVDRGYREVGDAEAAFHEAGEHGGSDCRGCGVWVGVQRKQVKLLGKFFVGTFLWGFFQWFYTGGDSCGFANFPTLGLKAYDNKFYFDFSPTYVGVGMICPHIVNISVLLGGILSWGLMWPLINNKKGEWYSASLPASSLDGLQGYRVFISIAMILGDGLYNFVKVLSHTLFVIYKVWKSKSKLPITDSDGNVVSSETVSFDDKRRTELFLNDQIPKKFALGGYVCVAIISIVTLPHIFESLKWYLYT